VQDVHEAPTEAQNQDDRKWTPLMFGREWVDELAMQPPGERVDKRAPSVVAGYLVHHDHDNGHPLRELSPLGHAPRTVDALGIGYVPPMTLLGASRRAEVLLGEIDHRGVPGRRPVNLLLAGALTGWRIRLKPIATSPAWRALDAARQAGRSVPADVTARVPKGLAVVVYGLHGLLPTGEVRGVRRGTQAARVDVLVRERLGHTLQVIVLRLEPDAGHIFLSERVPAGRQLSLPMFEEGS
jgi:hypothetical protein